MSKFFTDPTPGQFWQKKSNPKEQVRVETVSGGFVCYSPAHEPLEESKRPSLRWITFIRQFSPVQAK